MPFVMGRGFGHDTSVALEPSELSLLIKIKEAEPNGYHIHGNELIAAMSLYHRNMIREIDGQPWTYMRGRGLG